MPPLDDYGDALSYDIAFHLAGVQNAELPLPELGNLALEVGGKLRAMAILVLLVKADTNAFCHNLIRSGRARERFLLRCKQEGQTALRHYCAGRVDPIVDALAAGDLLLARQIVAAGPADFREGVEYEDDFCFAHLLACFAAGLPDRPAALGLLARLEAYLEGAASGRLAVCRALFAGDEDELDEALEARLGEREQEIVEDQARGQLEDTGVVATRRVFVEGIALLRLADARGIPTHREYRMCPSLARASMTRPFPGE
jgi:hypothetical protein